MYLLRACCNGEGKITDRDDAVGSPGASLGTADHPNAAAIPEEPARNGLAVLGQHTIAAPEEGQSEAETVDDEAEAIAADLAAKGLPYQASGEAQPCMHGRPH